MLKGAAWRLAQLLHVLPREVQASQDLPDMVRQASQRLHQDGREGEAARLAAKILRLRKP